MSNYMINIPFLFLIALGVIKVITMFLIEVQMYINHVQDICLGDSIQN